MLFLVKAILERSMGVPPSSATPLAAWAAAHPVQFAWADELTAFAAVLLVPVVPALYWVLQSLGRSWAVLGSGILAVILGRWCIRCTESPWWTPPWSPLVASLYYGGAHEVALLFAAVLTIVGVALVRRPGGRWLGTLGVVAGVSQVAASYPSIVGPDLVLACNALLGAWLVLFGATLAIGGRS
jgi:hypothetical protein